MNRAVRYGILGVCISLSAAVYGQAAKAANTGAPASLKLVGSITLPGVTGDFDLPLVKTWCTRIMNDLEMGLTQRVSVRFWP